jgi:hypothetical protein
MPLQGLHQKPHNKSYFPQRKHPYFWTCSVRGGFTFHSSFFILLTTKFIMRPLEVQKDCRLKPILDRLTAKFRSAYTHIPQRVMSVEESLMMWKGHLLWKVYIPSKCARFGIKSFELCEATSGYV